MRIYFKSKKNYDAVIFEPIRYYYNKLNQLYHNRNDILVKQQYVSIDQGEKKIYFIKPEVCDLIEIDNQNNDWLHGLGSFDKNNVEEAIEQNGFRGEEFKKNIVSLKNNIVSESVDSFELKNLNFPKNSIN